MFIMNLFFLQVQPESTTFQPFDQTTTDSGKQHSVASED